MMVGGSSSTWDKDDVGVWSLEMEEISDKPEPEPDENRAPCFFESFLSPKSFSPSFPHEH